MKILFSKLGLSVGLFSAALVATPTIHAQAFINGGFDDGTITGWTVGSGNRSGASFATINPSSYLNNISNRSAIVTPGLDPVLGGLMQNIVYSGTHSYRVEDAGVTGGLLSVVSQTVFNYTAPDIFFAWMAALDNGGHSDNESAGMIITLTDLTTNTLLINRRYNAGNGGGGVDARFLSGPGGYFYTPVWQIEQLPIDASLFGHNFSLIVLATDCGPTGHSGYVYLDGFGAVAPPPGVVPVPEPSTYGMIGAAALMAAVVIRRRKQAARA